jgi:hypothetical protein
VTPYPFGYDGNPVDPNSSFCVNVPQSCYLSVQSMAFRAWNRGLAAVSVAGGGNTPFGVWLYNGTRWYPNPVFPGQSVCKGSTVLWAGKLDYWLIGGAGAGDWPALCRFDGASYQWEPIAVPKATIAAVGAVGEITSGACFSWSNCWFFGTGGAVVHWDGQVLSNQSVGLGPSPWLTANYTDAVEATDAHGNPFAVASAAATTLTRPDGTPAPQLLSSTGGLFSPLSFSPQTLSGRVGSQATSLVAVAFNNSGQGWIAGEPSGFTPSGGTSTDTLQDAPLAPIAQDGTPTACPDLPASAFTVDETGAATSYLWDALGVMPDDTAIAGGETLVVPPQSNPQIEPVLVHAECNGPATVIQFRVADPENPTGPDIPADGGGGISAVAANAMNDAWAASTSGTEIGHLLSGPLFQPPHLYHFTDGGTPNAPAGDDRESRQPITTQQQQTFFAIQPPVIVPPPRKRKTIVRHLKLKHRTVKLPPPLYDVSQPAVLRLGPHLYSLTLSFKVRSRITIGLEGIRAGAVVSSSGTHTFSGGVGRLVLMLTPKRWPTALRFVVPHIRTR